MIGELFYPPNGLPRVRRIKPDAATPIVRQTIVRQCYMSRSRWPRAWFGRGTRVKVKRSEGIYDVRGRQPCIADHP